MMHGTTKIKFKTECSACVKQSEKFSKDVTFSGRLLLDKLTPVPWLPD